MKNQLMAQAVATASEPPAGAENVIAASLFDMPDLAAPMLQLAGWLLLGVVAGLLAAHGISRAMRKRHPPGDSKPEQETSFDKAEEKK